MGVHDLRIAAGRASRWRGGEQRVRRAAVPAAVPGQVARRKGLCAGADLPLRRIAVSSLTGGS